jgi:hypothetical protein
VKCSSAAWIVSAFHGIRNTQHNDIRHNDAQHNDTQHNGIVVMLSIVLVNDIMLNVTNNSFMLSVSMLSVRSSS